MPHPIYPLYDTGVYEDPNIGTEIEELPEISNFVNSVIDRLEDMIEKLRDGRIKLLAYDEIGHAQSNYGWPGPGLYSIGSKDLRISFCEKTGCGLSPTPKEADSSNATPEQINNCDYLRAIYGEQP